MTELEKFKRRLIRMVARLHVQEKKPEDELWEYLRKQTKCECKWLWERMRALTMKRLKRLLIAEDKQENIAAIARMSLTDWLLFDSILVHEKIDVIGTELMVEGRKTEPRPMFDLFSLVQGYDLEGLRGEDLARAWTAATVTYNSRGRQCSPMLLQRRWYQLKELTRQKFYNFWFVYRGNVKTLEKAMQDKPTRLQSAIAKRYPHIITTPFMSWEELIENRLIIMPDEFEVLMKTRVSNLPAPLEENDVDLVLLEPEIETIDLRVDSDSDNDLREEVEGITAKKLIADEDVAAVQSITLKQEPMDEDIDYVESINLDIDNMNLDMDIEGIEALENIDIPIEDDVRNEGSLDNTDVIESTEDETRESTEAETGISIGKDLPTTNTDSIGSDSDTVDVISSTEIDASHPPEAVKPELPDDVPITTQGLISEPNNDENEMNIEKPTSRIEILPDTVITPEIEASETSEVKTEEVETDNLDLNTETAVMPQISNVFGNVNISEESLHQLGSYVQTNQSEKIAAVENIDDEIEDDIIQTDIVDLSVEDKNAERNEIDNVEVTDSIVTENDCKIKTTDEKVLDNSFSEVISDVTFEDDGIEFIDDGIIEEQEHIQNEIKVKQEVTSNEDKSNGKSQSIDLKLLMIPVVYTRKLEHMSILKDKLISHVNDKESLELILNESKPVCKKIHIKEEQPVTNIVSDDDDATHDDLFDRPKSETNSDSDSDEESDGIPEEKKVSKSSILFQKPRNRDYTNPLVVCKNPDFNTRLKRLTVGFLSYTRNRFLLRACKPLTIDLCKAFESKLVDNTIYFKQGPVSESTVQEKIPDVNDNDRQTPPVVPQENLVQAPAVPKTNSVQSLIDTIVKQQFLSPLAKETTKDETKTENEDVLSERNKVIVLPNIDNVRRINRQLLVAEVSPMQLNNSNYSPPVSLMSPEKNKPSISGEKNIDKTKDKEICGGTVICSGEVIAGITNTYVTHNVRPSSKGESTHRKNKPKILPWRPLDTRIQVGFWNTAKLNKPQPTYPADQLLTIDTLNKMLAIIYLNPLNEIAPKVNKKKKKQKKMSKDIEELTKRVNDIQKKLTGSHSSDKNVPETLRQKRKRPKVNPCEDLTGYGTYCCWVNFMTLNPGTLNPHPCGVKCTCCCREISNDAETDPSIAKVCESIESVVEQSREIVASENICEKNENEINTIKDNTTENNIIDLDAVENNITENTIIDIGEKINTDVVESNAIETDNQSMNIIESNIDNNIIINKTVKSSEENITTENVNLECPNSTVLVEDSYEPKTQSILRSYIDITFDGNGKIIKRKRDRSPKSTQPNLIEIRPETTNKENNDKNSVTNIPDKTDLSRHLTSNAGDCMVIDSDDSDSRSLMPPPLKFHVFSAPQKSEIVKRRRGRPSNSIPQLTSNSNPTMPVQEIALKNTLAQPQEINVKKRRGRRSRSNVFPEVKEKEKEPTSNSLPLPMRVQKIAPKTTLADPQVPDKSILCLNSTHISKNPNNPIFLGKNKILLTDVPLLHIQNKSREVQSPTLNNIPLSLPRGVNLMLTPNGALSCTVDPNVQLTVEEITNLGAIIEDIQKRLSSLSNLPVHNLNSGPTLQLVPGAVPTAVQSTSEIVNLVDEENYVEENSNTDKQEVVSTMTLGSENVENVTSNAENSNLMTESVISSGENIVPVSDSVDTGLDVSAITTANISVDQPSSETTVTTETIQNINLSNNNQDINNDSDVTNETMSVERSKDSTDNSEKEISNEINEVSDETNETMAIEMSKGTVENLGKENCNEANKDTDVSNETFAVEVSKSSTEENSEKDNCGETNKDFDLTNETVAAKMNEGSTEENSEKERSNETATSNKKTILSDLMEMSGIFDEDIAPIAETTPELQVMSQYPSISEATNVVVPPSMHVLDSNQTPSQTITKSLHDLCPVTSFNELKYACLHNGNFFKLDLETRILSSINVCIKKKQTPPAAPSQFVDLTNDADDTVDRVTAKEKLQDEDTLPTFVVRKKPASSVRKISLLKKGAAAKPLKLFKVVYPYANSNILQKSKKEENPNKDIVPDTEDTCKATKRVRKQAFENKTYETQYVNFLSNDDEQENYEFDGSFEETAASVDDSDSSDDEPLAKKVRRREEAQKEVQEKAVDTATEVPSTSEEKEPETNELSLDVPETPENSELPMEGVEESEGGPTELEFISDHNEEEGEDCILGV